MADKDVGFIDWRKEGDKTIAAIISKEELGSCFLKKKINVHPGEAALFIYKGEAVNILSEGQELVSGPLDRLRKLFGGSEDLTLMMLDTHERIFRFAIGLTRKGIFKADPDFYDKMKRVHSSNRATSLLRVKADEEILEERTDAQKLSLAKAENDFEEKREGLKKEIDEMVESTVKGLLEKDNGKTDLVLLSKDRESIVIDVKLLVNFRDEKAGQVFKLLRGKKLFLEEDFMEMIKEELAARVFAPKISQYSANELRGNRNIFASLQNEAQQELFEWLDVYGVKLNRLSINPAMTEVERMAMLEKEKQALEQAIDFQLQRDRKKVEREYELLTLREQLGKQFVKAKRENDKELAQIARTAFLADEEQELSVAEIKDRVEEIGLQRKEREADLQFQRKVAQEEAELRRKEKEADLAHQAKTREQELQLKAKETEEELRLKGVEREWAVEKDKSQIQSDAEIRKMQVWAEEYRKNKDRKNRLKMEEMLQQRITAQGEQQHVEKMLEIAVQAGILNGDVVAEAIRQGTIRKALDQGEGAAQAVSQAEAQRFSRESFREGFMSHTPLGIAGQGPMYIQTGQPMLQPGGKPGQYMLGANQAGQGQEYAIPCPGCGKMLPNDMKFCGYCGAKTDGNQ